MPFLRIAGREYKAAIFDLDGVIVDTARYHYLAWKRIADELKIPFSKEDNERLKGVSRMASLDILLSLGSQMPDEDEKLALAERKNRIYREYLSSMDESALLPGAVSFLSRLRTYGIPSALGSASKNAIFVLERLGIKDLFSVIIDGMMTTKAKPDPEVFILAATKLGCPYSDSVVFEDSLSGIKAAKTAGMGAVGITELKELGQADILIENLTQAEGWIYG